MTEKSETPAVEKTEKASKASQGVLFDQLVAMEKGTEVKKRRGRPSKSKTEEKTEPETKTRKKTTSTAQKPAKSTTAKSKTSTSRSTTRKTPKQDDAEPVKKTPAKRGRKSKAEKEAEELRKAAAQPEKDNLKTKADSRGGISIFANKQTEDSLALEKAKTVKPVEPAAEKRIVKKESRAEAAELKSKTEIKTKQSAVNKDAVQENSSEPEKNTSVYRSTQKIQGKSSNNRNNKKESNTRSFSPRNKNKNDKNFKNKHNKKNSKNSKHYHSEQALPEDNREFENLVKLKVLAHEELVEIARNLEVKYSKRQKKKELMISILEAEAKKSGRLFSGGILEVLAEGYGFLRAQSYLLDHNDIYVSPSQIRKFRLRTGDTVMGHIRAPREGEGYNALLRVDSVNFEAPDVTFKRNNFEKLTPIYPNEKFDLETHPHGLSCRVIDLISPIGKGQRGLIVAPPKAGKTTLIKEIANSIMENYPQVELMVLLIDERPEEVTDMERSIKGEVISSTFDKPISNHIQVTEMVIEKAKRYVEQGKDVIILLDSLTRLARAYNIHVPSSGQTLTGGVNPLALYKPKKFFGSARNIEEGGSLTIIGTILVDTGSRMDEVIFEEFKGTGNMELILDRNLFQKRIFPAVNVKKSSTRREDLLIDSENLEKVWSLRKIFGNCTTEQAISLLLTRLKKSANNDAFLRSINIDKINSDDVS